MPNEASPSSGPLKVPTLGALKLPPRSRTPLLDGLRAKKARITAARTLKASPSKRTARPTPSVATRPRASGTLLCNSTSYAAALIGAVITWAERQDPNLDLPPNAHADSLKEFLKGRKMSYAPSRASSQEYKPSRT